MFLYWQLQPILIVFFYFKLRKSVRACERIVLRALFTLMNNSDEMEMS